MKKKEWSEGKNDQQIASETACNINRGRRINTRPLLPEYRKIPELKENYRRSVLWKDGFLYKK
jgi:hypothetical protein